MCASAPRFSGRERRLEVNYDSRFWREKPKQLQQLVPPQADAAGRRGKALPGDMDKHGAAPAGHARPSIMVDFDNQIVEAVVAAQPVAWFIGRPAERLVIAAIQGVLAPGIVAPDPAHRKQCPRPRQAIGPPPQADGMKSAGRRAAVAFVLRRLDSGAA